MSIFIDWITCSQRHPEGGLKVISDGMVVAFNPETEELHWESLKSHDMRGSFETGLRIRCDGHTVSMSGNVGRFGRPDNVFNLDFEQTILKANTILEALGLPAFSTGEKVINPNPSDYDVKHGLFETWTGCTFSRIDVTQNFETGSPDSAKRVIDWLDSQSVSHIRKARAGDTTINYGKASSRKRLKFYIKAPEMLAHSKNTLQTQLLDSFKYAQQTGLLRAELEMHRLYLRDNGLRFLGDIDMGKLIKLFDEETELLHRSKVEVNQKAIELDHLPAHVRMTALAYIKGDNPKSYLSKSAWYRQAKILRDYGIDIACVSKVVSFPISIRVVDISAASAPAWYWQKSQFVELAKAA